jgi:predicted dehydrogenase
MPVKLCMVGCGGFAGLTHGPAQRRYASAHGDVALSACCDVDADRARNYAQTFGFARSYSELSAMLRAEGPSAVIVAVPPNLSASVGLAVLEHGIPLLLEKPPGLSIVELNRLREAARKAKVSAQVAFNRRYMPVMQRASAILGSDRNPWAASRIEYDLVRNERWDSDFSTTAIHALDGALHLAGSLFRSVSIRQTIHRRGAGEAFDAELDGECESGARVAITILPVSGRNLEAARVHGIGQCLDLRLPFSSEGPSEGRLEHWRRGELIEAYTDGHLDFSERIGVYGETRSFIDAIRLGHDTAPRFDDCLQQVELMEALRDRRPGPVRFQTAARPDPKPGQQAPTPTPAGAAPNTAANS